MKIALAQINPIIGDFAGNAAKVRAAAQNAHRQGCALAVYPELCLSGYPPRDLLERADFIAAGRRTLERLAAEVRDIGLLVGLAEQSPLAEGKPLVNSAVLLYAGAVQGRIHKQLLPSYDVFDESRYFAPGPSGQGPLTFDGLRLGVTICEDAWNDKEIFPRRLYAEDPLAQLAATGCDVLVNLSASVFHAGKNGFRRHMLGSIARKYGRPLLFVNQVGGNDSVLFDGVSAAFNARGEVAAQAAAFGEDLVVFDSQAQRGDRRLLPADEIDEILEALVMGTRDYMHKCGFRRALVGLSGGIDSALVLCLASRALGCGAVEAIFMPSRYTSRENFEDTAELCRRLGVSLETIPIDGIYAALLAAVSPDLGEGLPGVTEQNLQARARGTILMGLSNKRGSLVLSTGNKSELAVGYCTLYGDMNGGLAVIADVPKTTVYALARRINAAAPVIPERILAKAPSAELKPDQRDQDDLPDYAVLDAILQGYIEQGRSPAELIGAGHAPQVVADVVRRVHLNEYKRQQAAPCLKVTTKAFGEGRRYPLAQRWRPAAGGDG
jgi:NAD+ synthetase